MKYNRKILLRVNQTNKKTHYAKSRVKKASKSKKMHTMSKMLENTGWEKDRT